MTAIEFQSTIREDGAIFVPQEYTKTAGKNVRVILLLNEKENDIYEDKYAFDAAKIDTVGFMFDREAANAR